MDRVRAWNAGTGHPDLSWSIVLEAAVSSPPSRPEVEGRLRGAWPRALGPAPGIAERDEGSLRRFADAAYATGLPLARVAIGPDSVLLATHHSALDGIGLLALLGIVLGAPLSSTAHGLGARPSEPAIRRLASLAGRPAARVPGSGSSNEPGDHLIAANWDRGLGTADLVAAAAGAVGSMRARGPVVVAVGASRRPGASPTLEDDSAYLRVEVRSPETAEVARRLRSAPAGTPPVPGRAALLATPLMKFLGRRLGATLLVSNLGRVTGPPSLTRIRFWPAAGGRSGVAIGAATVEDRTTLTLRAPRSGYRLGEGQEFLHRVGAGLTPDDRR